MQMKYLYNKARMLGLMGVIGLLIALFVYVVMRSGPLAPVPVTSIIVKKAAITPSLTGIGTVESRYTFFIGPTTAGRVYRVNVNVGDHVKAGDLLGEMDPVDINDRIKAQQTGLKRADAGVRAAEALVQEMLSRNAFAENQARRYADLFKKHAVSEESLEARQNEYQVSAAGLLSAKAGLASARQEVPRIQAEIDGLIKQKADLRLIAPVDGLVASRDADPGTTVVPGQSVVQLIDIASLWVNVRFEQLNTFGLAKGLSAQILLRSMPDQPVPGHLLWIEPFADAVTEEMLAKVTFDKIPQPLPPVGELSEVTVALPPLLPALVVPNAAIQRNGGQIGVWLIEENRLRFIPVKTGMSDLDGRVQILEGVSEGDRVVVHSHRSLGPGSRIRMVDRLPGAPS